MLTIIKTRREIRKFLVYDLEWIPGSLKVRIAGVYDGEQYRSYRSIRDFLTYELTSKNRGKWFYAHAGGLADMQFLIEEIHNINREFGPIFSVKAAFSGSSAIIVHIRRGKNVWHFCDSYWLLRDKLANIAKSVGMVKGGPADENEDELDDGAFEELKQRRREWYATVPYHELRDYNEGDCTILYRAIDRFQDTLLQHGGQLQMTLASSAMHLFRRKYLSKNLKVGAYANHCARDAYFASRVEVFQRSVKDAYYFDINSSFPFAMTFPCPGDYIGSSDTLPDKGIYIADVEVEVPPAFMTSAPMRLDNRVFFPFGRWRSWFTSVDIELLQREGGRLRKVYEVLKFSEFTDLASYATDIYDMRKKTSDPFEKVVFKLLLNSLYGKFAESPFKSSLELNPPKIDRDEMVMLFPGAWLRENEISIPHLMVPISAHITAMARRTLFNFMNQCRDFHYCDTDGFSTSEMLSTGNDLGALKLEKKIEDGIFVAPKVYRIKGKIEKKGEWVDSTYVRAKGFSRMTSERFFQILEGEEIEYERMSRIKERFRRGFHSPKESVFPKRIKLKSIYDSTFDSRKHSITKRFFYPDGTTRPWSMTELEDLLAHKLEKK